MISCSQGENYFVDGPHFNPPIPTTTFTDPIDSLSGQCGDLLFNKRVRSFTSIYASGIAEESPWKYWWRRARWADDGTTAVLDEPRKVSKAVNVLDTATISMWLNDQYDAIGAILILEDDSTLQISQWGEIAFAGQGGPWSGGLNISVQHWAHINPPILNSATVNGQNVTLTWTNQNRGRPIDSTNIYCTGWVSPKTVGPTDTSFVDSNVAPGVYTYSLKHVSIPAAPIGPPPPNSPASNEKTVIVVENYPPQAAFSVTCHQLPCTFADSSSDPDGSIASWLWRFGDGDSSTAQNPSHTYDEGGWYTVQLIVTDNEGAKDTASATAAPLELAISGPTWVKPKITCEWDAFEQGGSGGMSYSWRIGGQEVGTDAYLYWYTGTSGFQLTLIGSAGDGQVDTAAVSVTVSDKGASCVLKRG